MTTTTTRRRTRIWTLLGGVGALGLALALPGCLTSDAEDDGADTGSWTGGDTGGDTGSDTGVAGVTFTALYDGYLVGCAVCHSLDPATGELNGPGATSDTEASLDFSTRTTAYDTLVYGSATGLVGNQEACNAVAFIGGSYETSLLAAVVDEDVRFAFEAGSNGDCNVDSVSDMALKVGSTPDAAYLADLKAWIDDGAPDT